MESTKKRGLFPDKCFEGEYYACKLCYKTTCYLSSIKRHVIGQHPIDESDADDYYEKKEVAMKAPIPKPTRQSQRQIDQSVLWPTNLEEEDEDTTSSDGPSTSKRMRSSNGDASTSKIAKKDVGCQASCEKCEKYKKKTEELDRLFEKIMKRTKKTKAAMDSI